MVTFERRVGRLVEIYVDGENDHRQFARVIALANELGPDAKVIVLADVRKGVPLSVEQSQQLATIQRATRTRVQESITLITDSPVFKMVAQRIREQSGLPQRIVRNPAEAIAALEPLLNAAELARARQFLEAE